MTGQEGSPSRVPTEPQTDEALREQIAALVEAWDWQPLEALRPVRRQMFTTAILSLITEREAAVRLDQLRAESSRQQETKASIDRLEAVLEERGVIPPRESRP